MKQSAYQVQNLKIRKKMSFKIQINPTSLLNKMYLDAQIRFPARIQEDKRFKKPKHKHKTFE